MYEVNEANETNETGNLTYTELETPHTQDLYLAKPLDHPHIHYHSYEDFPPDFYKADFYD